MTDEGKNALLYRYVRVAWMRGKVKSDTEK